MSDCNSIVAMKVIMISGDSMLGRCGIDDYTRRLVESLKKQRIDVDHNSVKKFLDWFLSIRKMLSGDVIHIQYPTVAWRTSISPIVAAIIFRVFRKKLILTLHEFSRVHLLRKVLSLALLLLASRCVATNEIEAKLLRKIFGIKKIIDVVPIGSNIIPGKELSSIKKGVVYFGLLAPNKGLEVFLATVSRIDKYYPFIVIGSLVGGHEEWLNNLKNKYNKIDFKIGMSDDRVSSELEKSYVAYLPYPDGISERRGTALAALTHGLQVVTTAGSGTLDIHREICHICSSDKDAESLIIGLINGSIIPININKILNFTSIHSWDSIAKRHKDIYINL